MLNLEAKKLIALAESEEFQRIIEDDPILAEFSQPESDSGRELALLFDMFGALSSIGSVSIQPITPAVWSFLWITGNRFVTDRENITVEDADQFLYILTHGIKELGFELSQLPAKASGFVERSGLTVIEASAGILDLIHTAFAPLAMIPTGFHDDSSEKQTVEYGADWLAGIITAVSSVTNLDTATILFNTPLSTCFSYFIHYLRGKGVENIRKRSGAERVIAYNERMDELTQKFLTDNPNLGE